MPLDQLVILSVRKIVFLITLGLFLPIAILFIECVAALLTNRVSKKEDRIPTSRPTVAVLVPAHDEAAGIIKTINTIVPQLTDRDRLVVIADNCSDRTAELCRQWDVTVIERYDQQHKGKGYALDYGLQFISQDPPDVVIVFDADCQVHPGTIDNIAWLAEVAQRPIQPINILKPPVQANPKSVISAMAFMVKNLVRPIGLDRIGIPCLLTMGTAFPWSVIRHAPLASNNIVEDMQLGIDLAIAGHPPLFCSQGQVTGVLPQKEQAANSQKMRWIHGHLQTIFTQVPRLLKASLSQRRFDLLAIALDLCIPPISLLVIGWLITLLGGLLVGILQGKWTIAILSSIEGMLIFVSIIGTWTKFARNDIPLKTLLNIPLYLLWKIPIFLAFWIKRQQIWVRTERDTSVPQWSSSIQLNKVAFPTMFSLSSQIRATKEHILSEITSGSIIFHIPSGCYFSLNKIGTQIWKLIQEGQTIADLCDTILKEYAVTPEVCLDDLLAILEQLATKELIEVRN